MLKFLAKLFAAETRTAPNTKARLSLDAMETRYAPAVITNPGVARGFNPQPDPPANPAVTRTFVIEGGRTETPGEANGIIAITHPTTRGIIVEGGHTTRGIIVEGG